MCDSRRGRCARWARWCLYRNPMYLLSGAFMAVGARLYLVDPSGRAGEIGLILLTLGVLQAYEWAVTSILLALHAAGRAPEDKPSLLLVAALFWTGPMAAVTELMPDRPQLGLILAIGACAIALAELGVVRRVMGLRLSMLSRVAACGCVVFLALVPPLIRVPEGADGSNELFLYLAWWILGGLALIGVGSVRHHFPDGRDLAPSARARRDLAAETTFLTLVVGATAAHLVAMNYAYFTNARLFYASPLLVAIAVVGMEYSVVLRCQPGRLITACAMLPAAAIVWAFESFDGRVPIDRTWVCLEDPVIAVALVSAGAWWYGYVRQRWSALLHAGSAGLVLAAYRLAEALMTERIVEVWTTSSVEPWRGSVVMGLYAVAGYLAVVAILRRSRREGLASMLVHQAAVTFWVWDRTVGDVMIVCLVAGWQLFIALHLTSGWPKVWVAGLPVAFLTLVSWGYDFDARLLLPARGQAVAVVSVLLVMGMVRPVSGYTRLAGIALAADLLFYPTHWVASGANAIPHLVVIGGFGMLMVGAVVSWHKTRLLDLAGAGEPATPMLHEATLGIEN